ncbi:MAG TPA: FecR family protein [Thermoguttaceae bacterium]|nr:FecR family protein [Thermoguttaceae bacterium]
MAENQLDDIRNDSTAEFGQLVLRYLDEVVTPEEHELLETRLRTSDADRQAFLELCEQVCSVTEMVLSLHAPTCPEEAFKSTRRRTPIVTFLNDTLQMGMNFLSRPSVFTLLLTVGLPVVLLLVLWVHIKSQPIPTMPTVAAKQAAPPVVAVAAAEVARTHDCVWEESGEGPAVGASLAAGRQLRLRQGLVELRFADGATVLLQGPATFDAVGGGKGFLRAGSLVAKVSKEARGFTIQTPTADVVDLGTEFGVSVDKALGKDEVQVFRGKVVLEIKPAQPDRKPTQHHLTAGSAASIVLAAGQGEPAFHEIPFRADRYVRDLSPAVPAAPKPAIVADFSGGQGKSAVDQYPGIPGTGWATGWGYQTNRETTNNVSVERDNPLFDGGDYLRVLIERTSGTGKFHRTIERKLDLDGPVDLKKPYVLTFTVRIDSLNLFDDPGDLLIFSNNVASRLKRTKLNVTSGWHVRMGAQEDDPLKARNWFFISGDGKGASEDIDSGIPVREGETYSFRVLFDPPARRWVPSIAVNGGEWTTFGAMGMRSSGTAEECEYWPYFCLSWYMAGGNKGAETERVGFSVDSIRITAAEEDRKN